MRASRYSDGDNIKLAISAVICAILALSTGDALIKQFSAEFTLWQVFVLRSFLAIPVLIAVIKIRNRYVSLLPINFGWTALRSFMLTFQWIAYYIALPHIELSVAAASLYTLPLFITLFAALFVGEKVGLQGWVAVCMGFSGVLLVLRPQADDFNVYALLPLISAVLYAAAMVLTRTKCKNENPLILSFGSNVSMLIVGIAAMVIIWAWGPSEATAETYRYLLGTWSLMEMEEWLMMGLLATAIIIGSAGAAIAYQAGPSSIVATYDFFYVAFATIWGMLFFAEVPDLTTATGMTLIAVGGILAVRQKMPRD